MLNSAISPETLPISNKTTPSSSSSMSLSSQTLSLTNLPNNPSIQQGVPLRISSEKTHEASDEDHDKSTDNQSPLPLISSDLQLNTNPGQLEYVKNHLNLDRPAILPISLSLQQQQQPKLGNQPDSATEDRKLTENNIEESVNQISPTNQIDANSPPAENNNITSSPLYDSISPIGATTTTATITSAQPEIPSKQQDNMDQDEDEQASIAFINLYRRQPPSHNRNNSRSTSPQKRGKHTGSHSNVSSKQSNSPQFNLNFAQSPKGLQCSESQASIKDLLAHFTSTDHLESFSSPIYSHLRKSEMSIFSSDDIALTNSCSNSQKVLPSPFTKHLTSLPTTKPNKNSKQNQNPSQKIYRPSSSPQVGLTPKEKSTHRAPQEQQQQQEQKSSPSIKKHSYNQPIEESLRMKLIEKRTQEYKEKSGLSFKNQKQTNPQSPSTPPALASSSSAFRKNFFENLSKKINPSNRTASTNTTKKSPSIPRQGQTTTSAIPLKLSRFSPKRAQSSYVASSDKQESHLEKRASLQFDRDTRKAKPRSNSSQKNPLHNSISININSNTSLESSKVVNSQSLSQIPDQISQPKQPNSHIVKTSSQPNKQVSSIDIYITRTNSSKQVKSNHDLTNNNNNNSNSQLQISQLKQQTTTTRNTSPSKSSGNLTIEVDSLRPTAPASKSLNLDNSSYTAILQQKLIKQMSNRKTTEKNSTTPTTTTAITLTQRQMSSRFTAQSIKILPQAKEEYTISQNRNKPISQPQSKPLTFEESIKLGYSYLATRTNNSHMTLSNKKLTTDQNKAISKTTKNSLHQDCGQNINS